MMILAHSRPLTGVEPLLISKDVNYKRERICSQPALATPLASVQDAMPSAAIRGVTLEHSRSSVTPRIAAEGIASWNEASGVARVGWLQRRLAFAFIVYILANK